jgi:hypothetical protein
MQADHPFASSGVVLRVAPFAIAGAIGMGAVALPSTTVDWGFFAAACGLFVALVAAALLGPWGRLRHGCRVPDRSRGRLDLSQPGLGGDDRVHGRGNVGRDSQELVHPDDRDLNAARFAPLLARRVDAVRGEHRYLTSGGEARWVEVRARLALGADDEPVGLSGILSDVTDRRRTAEQLART